MTKSANVTLATVLIAGDHGVLRAGLRALFARYSYLKVVGEAADGKETLRLALQWVPSMVLLDINIREPDGLALTEALGRDLPGTRVLLLTAARDVEQLRSALRAGACGFVVKDASEADLMNAIAAVLRGELYLDPSVTRALLAAEMAVVQSGEAHDVLEQLTARETDVIYLLCEGYTSAQIARDLGLSTRTVESHRASVAQKLGTHSRADLVRLVNEHPLRPQLEPASTAHFGSP